MGVASTVDELLATPGSQERHGLLAARGLDDADGLTELVGEAERLVHERPQDSRSLALLCTDYGSQPAVVARAHYLLARLCAERGELARSLAHIETSRTTWIAAGRPLEALRTDLGRMQVLDDLGRHEDAVRVGTQVLTRLDGRQRRRQSGAHDESEARSRLAGQIRATAHNNVGVARSFLGDHQGALRSYGRAERGYRTLGLTSEVAKTRANRGIELLVLGQARRALAVLQSAERAFRADRDQLWAAKCAGNVAQAHHLSGDLAGALRELRRGRLTLRDLGADTEAARLQLVSAEVYRAAGLAPEAVEQATAAAEVFRAAGLKHDTGRALFTTATAQLDLRDRDAAAATLAGAVAELTAVGDAYLLARAAHLAAEIHGQAGELGRARWEITEACRQLAAGGWTVGLAWALLRRYDFAADHEQPPALAAAAEVIDRLRLPSLRFALGLRRSRRLRVSGDTAAAEAVLRSAIADLERTRSALPLTELQTAFGSDHAAAYDELIDLLLTGATTRGREALRASHRARAVSLADLVTGTVGARHRQPADPAWAALQRGRSDLSAIYHALFTTSEPGLVPQLIERAERLERQVLRDQVDRDLDLPGILGPQLHRETAVPHCAATVTYHLLRDDLLIFVDDGAEVTAVRCPGVRSVLEDELDRLRSQWAHYRAGTGLLTRHPARSGSTTAALLGQLHRLLWAPIEARLPDAPVGAPLVVLPHGRLQEVPFHALVGGDGAPEHLLERWTVIVAPTAVDASAPSPGGLGRTAATSAPRLLVVGVPDALAPAIRSEVEAIGRLDPAAEVLVGPAATVEAVRRRVPGPRVVHLACHGLYRAANPLFSALRLHDRWLTAAELLEFDFDGAVVVLGACESGRADPDRADPIGLAWAFLGAGAGSVVVSQWPVDDDATARLMTRFHQLLQQGSPPASALRCAQQEAARAGAHPYLWASFQLVRVYAGHPRGARVPGVPVHTGQTPDRPAQPGGPS